jgi:uncharacterized membrane protein YqjE
MPQGQEPTASLSTPALVAEAARETVTLVKSEMELARAELKEDLRAEVAAATGLSVAAVCGLLMVTLLLVAAVFALATVMPGWLAALVVAAAVGLAGAIAGVVGWKRVRVPLARTRRSLEEDRRWIKERTA